MGLPIELPYFNNTSTQLGHFIIQTCSTTTVLLVKATLNFIGPSQFARSFLDSICHVVAVRFQVATKDAAKDICCFDSFGLLRLVLELARDLVSVLINQLMLLRLSLGFFLSLSVESVAIWGRVLGAVDRGGGHRVQAGGEMVKTVEIRPSLCISFKELDEIF